MVIFAWYILTLIKTQKIKLKNAGNTVQSSQHFEFWAIGVYHNKNKQAKKKGSKSIKQNPTKTRAKPTTNESTNQNPQADNGFHFIILGLCKFRTTGKTSWIQANVYALLRTWVCAWADLQNQLLKNNNVHWK